MEKQGIRWAFLWKEQVQRGHARDGRKFKPSLMWLTGETSRQNSGNHTSREGRFDFLWEREQSPCEAPVEHSDAFKWAEMPQGLEQVRSAELQKATEVCDKVHLALRNNDRVGEIRS